MTAEAATTPAAPSVWQLLRAAQDAQTVASLGRPEKPLGAAIVDAFGADLRRLA